MQRTITVLVSDIIRRMDMRESQRYLKKEKISRLEVERSQDFY